MTIPAPKDPDAELNRILTGMRNHFSDVMQRRPETKEFIEDLAEFIDDYLATPGKFEIAPDGTAESTYKLSEKNEMARETMLAIVEMTRVFPLLILSAESMDQEGDESLKEAGRTARIVLQEFAGRKDLFHDLHEFAGSIPTRKMLKEKALKEAARELSAAAGTPAQTVIPAPANDAAPQAGKTPAPRSRQPA